MQMAMATRVMKTKAVIPAPPPFNVGAWCQCGKCQEVEQERECVCCVDVDEIKYFD